jgi:phosphoglycolate phosphatase-like HAD superfamily hydrolase
MSKILFWALDGALARRAPEWRLADGALDTLRKLSGEGWRHVVVAAGERDAAAICDRLGLAAHVDRAFDAASPGVAPDAPLLPQAIEALRPFDEAFVVGAGVADDVSAAREASLPSILVGDASPSAQFCVETLPEIPLALETWKTMRRAFLI